MSNNSTINVQTKNNRVNKITKLDSTHLEITLQYITLTSYYIAKEHIQMISNNSTSNVETKNNRVNKITKLHLRHLEFTLKYITLTNYYIVNDTFR